MPSAGRNIAAACLLTFATVVSSQSTARVESCRPGVWALTFDDGPSEHTPTLLKHLEDAGVKASFFVLGSQLENEENVEHLKQAFEAGHQIASHTYSHQNLSSIDEATMTKEMADTDTKIEAAIGRRPNYMRPPFGECAEACEPTMGKLGYTIAIWNIDSQDWRYADKPAEQGKLVEDIKRYQDGKGPLAKPTDPQGIVSLQHDIHAFSVERAPQIIEYIKSQGYTFATVAECGQEGDRPGPYREGGAETTSEPAAQPEDPTASSVPVNPTTGGGVVQNTTVSGEPVNATTTNGAAWTTTVSGEPVNATNSTGAAWGVSATTGGDPVNATTASGDSWGTSSTTSSEQVTDVSGVNRTSNSVRNRRVNEANALGSSASVVCPPGQFAAWIAAGVLGLTKLF